MAGYNFTFDSGTGAAGSAPQLSPLKPKRITATDVAKKKGLDIPLLSDIAGGTKHAFQGVLDLLGAPQHMLVAGVTGHNVFKNAFNHDMSWSKQLDLNDGIGEKALGVGLNLVADPLNAVGLGIAAKGVKAAEGAGEVAKALEGSRDITSAASKMRPTTDTMIKPLVNTQKKLDTSIVDLTAKRDAAAAARQQAQKTGNFEDFATHDRAYRQHSTKLDELGAQKANIDQRLAATQTDAFKQFAEKNDRVLGATSNVLSGTKGPTDAYRLKVRFLNKSKEVGPEIKSAALAKGMEKAAAVPVIGAGVRAGQATGRQLNQMLKPGNGEFAPVRAAASGALNTLTHHAHEANRTFQDLISPLSAKQQDDVNAYLHLMDGKNIDAKRDLMPGADISKLGKAEQDLVSSYHKLTPEQQAVVGFMRDHYDNTGNILHGLGLIDGPRLNYHRRTIKDSLTDFRPDSAKDLSVKTSISKARRADNIPLDKLADLRTTFSDYQRQLSNSLANGATLHSASRKYGISSDMFKGLDKAEQEGFRQLADDKARGITSNAYFPTHVADQLERSHKLFSSPKEVNNLYRMLQGGTQKFKLAVTSPNPGFLPPNILGAYNNLIVEGFNPADVKGMDAARKASSAIMDVLEKGGDRNQKVKLGKMEFTAGELADHALAGNLYDTGLLGGELRGSSTPKGVPLAHLEDFKQLATKAGAKQAARHPLNTYTGGMTNLNARYSENLPKLHGFTYFLHKAAQDAEKGAPEHKARLLTQAGQRANNAVFDYGDITPFMRHTGRTIVPFATFLSKNAAFTAKKTFENPGVQTAPFRLQDSTDQASGKFDKTSTPDYLLDGALHIGTSKDGQKGYFLNPKLPGFDMLLNKYQSRRGTGLDGQNIVGDLNPVPKSAIELLLGQRLGGTGAPIQPGLAGKAEYLARNFGGPTGSNAANYINPGSRTPFNQKAALLSQLLGFRVTEVDKAKQDNLNQYLLSTAQRAAVKQLRDKDKLPSQAAIQAMNRKPGNRLTPPKLKTPATGR